MDIGFQGIVLMLPVFVALLVVSHGEANRPQKHRHSGLDPESDQRECRASNTPLDSRMRGNDAPKAKGPMAQVLLWGELIHALNLD